MWQALHDAWWRLATQSHPQSFSDAVVARVLSAGSVVYQAGLALRNTAYDRGWTPQMRLPCRVVSVGNLTVGGTGKTACVELVTKKLQALGRRVAVLSRGYEGRRRAYWLQASSGGLLVDGQLAQSLDGLADEPQLLARRLDGVPILVGARRDRTGRLACEQFSAEVVVLDDGFQHRRLARDCDIVLVHVRTPFDGGALLPRGPMREPFTALARAHVIIITKADEALETVGALSERLRALNPEAALVTAVHTPVGLVDAATGTRHEPARLSGCHVGLLSSIGDPMGFEHVVRRLHATVLWHRMFPDHHRYTISDWTQILQQAQAHRPEALVTTEKDWIRLRPHAANRLPGTMPVWVLDVQMRLLSGEDALDDRLARVCAR